MKDINFKVISEKLINPNPVALDLQELTVSEYNTRHNYIDQLHVNLLAAEIEKNSFYPGKALHVNLDAGKRYKLVVGVNRFKALKQLGYKQVLCYVYNNLTPEEQVYLDAWDNRSDELHKPYHFLQEGEHYLLLLNKGWSYQKIAEIKEKSKSTIFRKIKIAKLPEQVKDIIQDSLKYPDTIFEERNFQHICSLKNPELIMEACKKIYEIGKQAARGIGRKLQNGQIKELISTMKATVQNQQEKNIPLPGQTDPIINSEEYMQQELNFNLEPFRGKGQCMIPAWILDLILHPEINRYERDIISYLIKETYGQHPPRKNVLFDVYIISQITNIPVKNVPYVIEALKIKGIIVKENNLLAIRDIDNVGKQELLPVKSEIVKEEVKTDNTVEIEQIATELKKQRVSDTDIPHCKSIVLKKGGLPYLKAQIEYCDKKKQKGKIIRPGYLVHAIESNYADYTIPPVPINNTNSTVNDNNEKKETLDAKNKLFDDYSLFIDSEIKSRTLYMSQEDILKLNNTLIENACVQESMLLLPQEKESLKDIHKNLENPDLHKKQLILYQYLLTKLHIAHFNLTSFAAWKKQLNSD